MVQSFKTKILFYDPFNIFTFLNIAESKITSFYCRHPEIPHHRHIDAKSCQVTLS